MSMEECPYCDAGKPLVSDNINDRGIAIQHKGKLLAYGYDVHGYGSNGLQVSINYCPMCGKKLNEIDERRKENG